mmetsp:Transcript_53875/g.89446  ORF Transcript_53875/g.89446 Transcript_53875/m.89446 type:complete len:315 (+) Transcript_53875:56-1000(+)
MSVTAHVIDVVIAPEIRSIYVVNVKAGSRMILGLLQHNDHCLIQHNYSGCCRWVPYSTWRTTTRCLALGEFADYFVFSFVRDPVTKFESGVRQAWHQDHRLRHLSADELLHRQLAKPEGVWMNEHLQSNNWRLSGIVRVGQPVSLNFVGRLEAVTEDVEELLAKWPPLRTAFPTSTNLSEPQNRREITVLSLLSPEARCALCASRRYGVDYLIYKYPFPASCSCIKSSSLSTQTLPRTTQPSTTQTNATAIANASVLATAANRFIGRSHGHRPSGKHQSAQQSQGPRSLPPKKALPSTHTRIVHRSLPRFIRWL